MPYTEEEITKYTIILQNFNDGLDVNSEREEYFQPKFYQKSSCNNCGNTHFFKDKGTRYCNKCFYSVGRVLINDFNYKDRIYFQNKSIYKREYHFQNKIDEISKTIDLEIMPEIYNRLWLKLKKIDNAVGKINEKYERKRMINISYLIKRVLGEYDKTEADKIQLNISEKTLKLYEEWFDNFKNTQ